MLSDDDELMRQLEAVAAALFDGHLTIMRFTTNWRVGFGTPSERDEIEAMPAGHTFAAAARNAINGLKKKARWTHD
jgi:hypothetical protein